MIPVIIPVISGEEGRGVWSSNRKQSKSLQVEQEQEFQQRSAIPGWSPNGVRWKNMGIKIVPPNENRIKSKGSRLSALLPQLVSECKAAISVDAR